MVMVSDTCACMIFTTCRDFGSESDIFNRLAEDLGTKNACSFQSLLYYLTTGSQYLLESTVCRVFTSEEAVTVVNFTVYCG